MPTAPNAGFYRAYGPLRLRRKSAIETTTGLCLGFTPVFFTDLLTLTIRARLAEHAVVLPIDDALGLTVAAGAVRGRGGAHGLAT